VRGPELGSPSAVVIAGKAKQTRIWIASSLALIVMTSINTQEKGGVEKDPAFLIG